MSTDTKKSIAWVGLSISVTIACYGAYAARKQFLALYREGKTTPAQLLAIICTVVSLFSAFANHVTQFFSSIL